jgi:hypothetical protein
MIIGGVIVEEVISDKVDIVEVGFEQVPNTSRQWGVLDSKYSKGFVSSGSFLAGEGGRGERRLRSSATSGKVSKYTCKDRRSHKRQHNGVTLLVATL